MANKILHKAASDNDLPLVEKLLFESCVDVNARFPSHKTTPLHWAAKKNEDESHFEVAQMLLKNGADPNAQDDCDRTPLYYLVEKANVKILQLFLSFNANFKVEDELGQSVLFPASINKNFAVMKFLLDLGLDPNHRSDAGKTPVHFACGPKVYDNLKTIKCLLKHGANMNALDHDGYTPLMDGIGCKVKKNYEEIMKKRLNFILEHSDLNVAEDRVNILKTSDKLLSGWHRCVIFKHLVKLKVLNIPIHPDILDTVYWGIEDYLKYFNRFERELLRAKSTKLPNSWLNFFNLVTDDRKKLKNYAGNWELIEGLQKINIQDKFPIYGAAMEEKVKKGMRRRQLYDESAVVLSDCLPIFSPSHLILRDVLDCIMSKKDL